MKTHATESPPQTTTRLAGILYLVVVPLGIFSLSISGRVIVPGDAAATASNILASEGLFRFGIVSDLLATLIMMAVALTLYNLLKPVNENMAALMVIFVLIGVSISVFDKLNVLAVLQTLSVPDYLSAFTIEQVQALAYHHLRLSDIGSTIAFIFWGLWLFPLGYLVFKSGFLPKILGILLMISCMGYVVNSLAYFLGYSTNFGMVSVLGEVLFILWLLIKGVDVEGWKTTHLNQPHSIE